MIRRFKGDLTKELRVNGPGQKAINEGEAKNASTHDHAAGVDHYRWHSYK